MATPVTVILGLGQEVGEALARRFVETGHAVLAADTDQTRIDRAREALPDKVTLFHGDLQTRIGLRNCLAAAEENHPQIDNLVIVPDLAPEDRLSNLDIARFEKFLSEGVRGTTMAMNLFAERIAALEDQIANRAERVRQHGSVTVVLSQMAELANVGEYTRAVTQGAILAAVRSAAVELASQQIRVNAISAIRPRAEAEEGWDKSRVPLGRAALADEIADAALYLSSRAAAIVTGATLVLDGGRSVLAGRMP
ncbi:MAG: SDR family oxidoreductase [Pseudomonadota bacterium]